MSKKRKGKAVKPVENRWARKGSALVYEKPELPDYETIYAAHPKLYLAYGSNLNVLQMQVRCDHAEPVTHGFMIDYKLAFSSVATIEKSPGDKAPIAVWRVTPSDIGALDRYEGFPGLYGKRDVNITILGVQEKCFTYVLNPPYDIEPPWTDYFDTIEEGYKEWGLDPHYLEDAVDDAHERWEPITYDYSWPKKGSETPSINEFTRFNPYSYLDPKHQGDSLSSYEECYICGEWEPMSIMSELEGHYICAACDYYKDEGEIELSTVNKTRQWWQEAKDVNLESRNWNDPLSAGYDPHELDYHGSFWNDTLARTDYPVAY